MTTLFALLLIIHSVQAFVGGLRRLNAGNDEALPKITPVAALMHVPLFIIAIIYTIQTDAWGRDMVSPLYWAVGLMAGHVLFAISVSITNKSLHDAWETLKDVRDFVDFLVNAPSVISRYVTVAFGEEVIWRMAAQPIAITFLAMVMPAQQALFTGIVLIAVLFTICHEKVLRRGFAVAFEFLLFSLFLGALYHFTGSIALCMAIHFVRDAELAYDEYIAKVVEWKDRERAADFIDRRYDFRRAPQS